VTNVAQNGPKMTSTPEEAEYELRASVSAYWSGGRLLVGMFTFLMASLAFAYFYLRSSNSGNLWRPAHVTAPTAIGAAVVAFAVVATLLVVLGYRRFQTGAVTDWKVAGWSAVMSLILAIGLQIYQLTQLPFFPGSSGYSSTFIGWAVINVVLLLSCLYWIETLLATSMRLRNALSTGETVADSPLPRAQKFRANVESCTFFFQFAALVSVLFWALFYLI
jgi:hypothetical protein